MVEARVPPKSKVMLPPKSKMPTLCGAPLSCGKFEVY